MNLIGQKFGRLTVIQKHPLCYITPSTGKRQSRWECRCECGNTTVVVQSQLISGHTRSCGCLQRERSAQAHTIHGGRYDRLHSVWANMKNRCNNPNYSEYASYGGRGIRVCEEWDTYPPFKDWAMLHGYRDDSPRGVLTLDRIDVNGPYSPDNCRFVDMFEQANNKQNTVLVDYEGQTKTISQWSDELGIKYDWIYYRVRTKGMSLQEALEELH